MHLYFGLALWGVVAFVIYKAINYVLMRRQYAGMSMYPQHIQTLPQY